ncbi:MAG: hypothetical protein GX577_01695 [Leptolinea sp.]|nr:hypothetical protein [Leptolinea sp.]
MDDLTSSFIVIGVTALVVAAIFFFSHRSKERNQKAIQDMAVRHGWEYTVIRERLAWGSQLSGKNWDLVARSEHIGQPSDSGSANIQSDTTWKAAWNNPPGFTMLIGPRLSNSSVGLFIPPEYAGMKELETGMSEFAQRYVVLGKGEYDLDFLRISTIPRQLLNWSEKNRPLIKIDQQFLEIKTNNHRIDKPEELEQVVLLGEAILAALDR